MKSPVGVRGLAGNIKCKGKKTKLLSCFCCTMIDLRWEQRIKEAQKEIKNETKAEGRQGT